MGWRCRLYSSADSPMSSWPPTSPPCSCCWCPTPPHSWNLSTLKLLWQSTCPYCWWPQHSSLGTLGMMCRSYVRLVDIWLIFGQLVPFIEDTKLWPWFWYVYVLFFHLLKLNSFMWNVEEDAINHHGFERKVPEFQKNSKESYTKRIYNVATFFCRS